MKNYQAFDIETINSPKCKTLSRDCSLSLRILGSVGIYSSFMSFAFELSKVVICGTKRVKVLFYTKYLRAGYPIKS